MVAKALAFAFLITVNGVFAQEDLRTQCSNVGIDISPIVHNYYNCISKLRMPPVMQNTTMEYEIATNFCSNTTQKMACYSELLDGLAPCLNKTSQVYNINSQKQRIAQLFDNACGSVTELLAENGVECIKKKSLNTCFTKNIFDRPDLSKMFFDIVPFEIINLNNEQCAEFEQVPKCVTDKMITCGPIARKMMETCMQDIRAILNCASAGVAQSIVNRLG